MKNKDVKFFTKLLLLFVVLFPQVKTYSNEEKYKYNCANKFYRYYLDNEPIEYGLSAGYYEPGKEAYIGLSLYSGNTYNFGRLQINPPGIELCNVGGPGYFLNDSSQIWYLYNDKHHNYKWVDSSDGKVVENAIEVGEDALGYLLYIGKIQKKDEPVIIGVVVPFMGVMYYVDHDGISKKTTTDYQVLTCRSCRKEEKIPMPKIDTKPNIDDSNGCIHKWQLYNNDDSLTKTGISAGEYDCGNTAYIGKAKNNGVFIPGRIQTISPTGFYSANANKPVYLTNGSYYLVDNPNYTYTWIQYNKIIPSNLVYVRNDIGAFAIPIAKIKINGKIKIGKFLYPTAAIADENGNDFYYEDFKVLVCDPWPKYKCAQQWKKLNANISVDGFNVDSTSFIGRGTRKCINGCDYGLGKIQSGSNGVNYLDDLTSTAVFDNSSNVEYLVKNPSDTYKWQPSRNGVKVVNALELHKEGHRPFYIGMTRINDNVVVGKVRPGDGLFFIDPVTGKQQSTSSYEVLTCTSPDASNGEYEEESDVDWFGSFGCPVRKEWSFIKWRCVCRDELRGVFAANGAQWNEETCSYVNA
ncbi:hypothetical protein PVAND_015230 [Polypedilum vanderplanki]|uniref:Uncharacterized protein n=1 Tax=Polypedilum vanderplanki TaxID=319348 RepID=A0A9J6BCF7_POLVA|nr:hypothetical protein PVAND_015230 [Polypedilum vanderplanki]